MRERDEEPMDLRDKIIDILAGLGVDPDDHEKAADEILKAVAEDDLAIETGEDDAA